MKTETLVQKLLNAPPCDWEILCNDILKQMPAQTRTLSNYMEDAAGRLAFLAEYITQRATTETHVVSAKRANKQCRRVNRALGYTYADRRTFRI